MTTLNDIQQNRLSGELVEDDFTALTISRQFL